MTTPGIFFRISFIPSKLKTFDGLRSVMSLRRLNTRDVIFPPTPPLMTVPSFKTLLQSPIAVMLSPRKIMLPGTIGSLVNWVSLSGVCSGIEGTLSKRFWLAVQDFVGFAKFKGDSQIFSIMKGIQGSDLPIHIRKIPDWV